ncbi:MAG: TIGR02217 family protein [Rhizomicrobium sp.]
MMFHEIQFPTAIAFHSSGGPERKTEIVTLGSGFEERNAVWANSRRHYDVGYGVKTLDDLHAVIAFFEARLGRLYGFRFKDFADFKSCAFTTAVSPLDQPIGTGDGATTQFQLIKTYTSGPSSWVRTIDKPVSGTARVAVAGVEQTSGITIDDNTGLIAFDSPPASGAAIAAGFEFDTPVRFDTDSLSINLSNFAAGEIPSIPLVEIRI